MKRRIHKFVTTHPGYKLLSLVLAFALWLIVYNSEDPNRTTTFAVPLTIQNEAALTEQGKCYQIVNNSGTVTFAVTAKRSILEKLDSSDFKASVNLTDISISEDGKTGTAEIEITAERYATSVKINGRSKRAELALEDLVTKQFVVMPKTVGNVKSGYALGVISADSPNVLKVTGPESVVERIVTVTATIDVEGMNQNISASVTPVLRDEAGQEISTSRLTLSNDRVSVRAQILDTKEVALQFSTTGKPDGDSRVLGILSEPSSVWVKGTTANLNKLTALVIPSETLNVEGASDDIHTTIKISEYLPDGIELLDEEDDTVEVTVQIETYETRNFNLQTGDFEEKGLADGLLIHYNVSAVTVGVTGISDNMELLDSTKIKAEVDLSGFYAGVYNIPVTLDLDADLYTYEAVRVPVTISGKMSAEE